MFYFVLIVLAYHQLFPSILIDMVYSSAALVFPVGLQPPKGQGLIIEAA
jgi:hypothetical protein